MDVIVLSGPPKAGKGEAVSALSHHGWVPVSMSAVLRDIVFHDPGKHFNRKSDITRQDLFEGAIKYRSEYGGGFIAEKCIEKIDKMPKKHREKIVIDGVRHPGEIEALKKAYPNAHFIGIIADENQDTDFEIRWQRFQENSDQRGRKFEPHDRDRFLEQDRTEWDNPQSEYGSKIGRCLEMIAAMSVSNRGKILINAEGMNRQEWGERVLEYVNSFEGGQIDPERKG